ncbi:MAG TPA: MFS transporter [Streptosporangiaceae bacterium]|nr:MFS transporter [Streptosporangiaceae bacterium]
MAQQQAPRPQAATLSPALIRLMAITCAVTVANLYYAQPLLHAIGGALHVGPVSASLLVTAAQLGYAIGLLLVVPVGDITRRRPLLTGLLAVDTLALAASAVAPNLQLLGALAVVIGVTSVVVQMLVPYAATLAPDAQRSRVIGTLMSGLLIGILLSRTFSGVIAAAAGWRVVYGAAAGAMALTTIALRLALPDHRPELAVSYREQMRGVLAVARSEPVLRWRSVIGACGFAAFGCFWTTVTFLLSGPQYGFSQLGIGLFALVGAAGAVTAAFGGRLLDSRRDLRWAVAGVPLALTAVSFLFIGLGGAHLGAWSLVLLIIGVLLMDACVQASHVINQSVIYDLLPEARSRLTTIYMTTYFIGGAAGSAAGSQAYAHGGWAAASATAALFPVLVLLAWLASRPHERAQSGQQAGAQGDVSRAATASRAPGTSA